MPPRTRSAKAASAAPSTVRPGSPAARPRRPAHRPADRIVVCCGAGGVGKTTTAAALGLWAAEHGRTRRRPHHRPGPPARPVARADRARQHARARSPESGGGTARLGRLARRDDARHEAHLRRGGRAARHPREGRPDPREPVLPGRLELVRGHAGVHGDGEARPAARRGRPGRPLGPHRRRHSPVAVGAGLPRRPQAARVVPRRAVHPAALRPGQGRRSGRLQGVQRRGQRRHQHPVARCWAASCCRTCRPSWRPSTRCSAASASAPTRPTRCSRTPRPRSSWSPRPSATRCARPPSSPVASTRRVCRSPASS